MMRPSEPGYCYLRAVRHEERERVGCELGPWPTVGELCRYSGSFVDSRLLPGLGVQDLGSGRYHMSYDVDGDFSFQDLLDMVSDLQSGSRGTVAVVGPSGGIDSRVEVDTCLGLVSSCVGGDRTPKGASSPRGVSPERVVGVEQLVGIAREGIGVSDTAIDPELLLDTVADTLSSDHMPAAPLWAENVNSYRDVFSWLCAEVDTSLYHLCAVLADLTAGVKPLMRVPIGLLDESVTEVAMSEIKPKGVAEALLLFMVRFSGCLAQSFGLVKLIREHYPEVASFTSVQLYRFTRSDLQGWATADAVTWRPAEVVTEGEIGGPLGPGRLLAGRRRVGRRDPSVDCLPFVKSEDVIPVVVGSSLTQFVDTIFPVTGFRQVAGVWVTHRRNYFSLEHTVVVTADSSGDLMVVLEQRARKVESFVLSVRALAVGRREHDAPHLRSFNTARVCVASAPVVLSDGFALGRFDGEGRTTELGRLQFSRATVKARAGVPAERFRLKVSLSARVQGADLVVTEHLSEPFAVFGRSVGGHVPGSLGAM